MKLLTLEKEFFLLYGERVVLRENLGSQSFLVQHVEIWKGRPRRHRARSIPESFFSA
jgi:hypothetical protein